MTLKFTLTLIVFAIAANAFGSLQPAAYAGKIQEQVRYENCDDEDNCLIMVKEVLGEATLKEAHRYQAGSITTLVLKAEQTAATRGQLDGADFVSLEMDMSKALSVKNATQVPVHMAIQSYSVEDEEMLFRAYNGACTFGETLICLLSSGPNANQRFFLEVK
jgi:hypothetical protein